MNAPTPLHDAATPTTLTSTHELQALCLLHARRSAGITAAIGAVALLAQLFFPVDPLLAAGSVVTAALGTATLLLLRPANLAPVQRGMMIGLIVTCAAIPPSGLGLMGVAVYIPVLIYIGFVEYSYPWRIALVSAVCVIMAAFTFEIVRQGAQPVRLRLLPEAELTNILIIVVVAGISVRIHHTFNDLALQHVALQSARLGARVNESREALAALEERRHTVARFRRDAERSLRSEHATRAQLEASREQLEQFAYAASHDLKEPVRTIRSFVQMVRRRLPAGFEAEQELVEHFTYVDTSSQAMHTLLERLLLYSRTGREGTALTAFNPQRLFDLAVARHDPALAAGPATWREGPEVMLDSDHAAVVFAELVDNAFRFVAPGVTPAVRLEVGAPAAGSVPVWITDNGIGIDPAYHEQVFGLFKRLHGRDEFEGGGVGLALVRRIVEASGGEVWLDGTVGVGTRVVLRLPLAGAPEPA